MKDHAKTIDDFRKANILVIGDIMLDQYVHAHVSRISPEAPVPIAHVKSEKYVLGGAANVAHNIAALGGKVSLIGRIGTDVYAEKLLELTKEKNIITGGVVRQEGYPTILKTRIVGLNQQLLRIDREDIKQDSGAVSKSIPADLGDYDIILISDYAKGTISPSLMEALKKASGNVRILVDPRPKNIDLYKGVYLVSPNLKEAEAITHLSLENGDTIDKIGTKLKELLGGNILITLGAEGMALFEGVKRHFPTQATEVYDVSGAGDTVISTMALALAAGADLESAVDIANHAAGVVVKKPGTATLSSKELAEALSAHQNKA